MLMTPSDPKPVTENDTESLTVSTTVEPGHASSKSASVSIAIQWAPWIYAIIALAALVYWTIEYRKERDFYRKTAVEWRCPGRSGSRAGDLPHNHSEVRKAIESLVAESAVAFSPEAKAAQNKGLRA